MPGGDKKWDVAAERDLCVAVILGNQETDRARYNWPKVHAFMDGLGYGFTRDAISYVALPRRTVSPLFELATDSGDAGSTSPRSS